MIIAQLTEPGFFFFFRSDRENKPLISAVTQLFIFFVPALRAELGQKLHGPCGTPCRGSTESQSFQRRQNKKMCCLLQRDWSFWASREDLIWLIHLNPLPFPDGGEFPERLILCFLGGFPLTSQHPCEPTYRCNRSSFASMMWPGLTPPCAYCK